MSLTATIITDILVTYTDEEAWLLKGRRWVTVTRMVESTVYVAARGAGLGIDEAHALGREARDLLNDHQDDGRTNLERVKAALAAA